ncbi:hypothetical protein ACFQLX_10675 [Streptomyces polyrhachis]|uniref:Transmembrane protein n=1 Tax=Streptomyces polyrhachis TaxID=1282885 RepID=A0ABW2GG45_9ACTN
MEAAPRDSRQDPPPDEAAGLLHDAPPAGHDGDDTPLPPGNSLPMGEESFRELRPPRLLRFWQLAPITVCAVLGSLMFAFPLAFEFGDGGAVVAMLGLLISLTAGGWALMAARRVGYTLPGLGAVGPQRRARWRAASLYAATVAVLVALAVWRIARLR